MEPLYNDTSQHALPASEFLSGYSYSLAAFLTSALLAAVFSIFLRRDPASSYPIANPKKTFELSTSRSVLEFAFAGREVLSSALKRFGPKPFRVHTDMGTFILLRPEHGEEIRNDPRFSVDEPIIEVRLASRKSSQLSSFHFLVSLSEELSADNNVLWSAVPSEIPRV